MLLKNKVCIITGCNRGIGASTLDLFAQEGAIIYANSRQEGVLEDKKKQLESNYECKVIPVYFDVRDSDAIQKTIREIQKEYGYLDVLINNAGVMRDANIGMLDKDIMRETFETNVFGAMDMLQYAARMMKKKRSGSIINFASVVGVYGNSGQMMYSASKGAVISMTRTAAKELSSYNIRVNAVAPGMIDTDMFRSIGEERMNEHLKRIGMGRFGTPEDVARLCVMLASDYSEYVTGQIIGVDGGVII